MIMDNSALSIVPPKRDTADNFRIYLFAKKHGISMDKVERLLEEVNSDR